MSENLYETHFMLIQQAYETVANVRVRTAVHLALGRLVRRASGGKIETLAILEALDQT